MSPHDDPGPFPEIETEMQGPLPADPRKIDLNLMSDWLDRYTTYAAKTVTTQEHGRVRARLEVNFRGCLRIMLDNHALYEWGYQRSGMHRVRAAYVYDKLDELPNITLQEAVNIPDHLTR